MSNAEAKKLNIVVLAYIAVFFPWTALALFDFINDRWRTCLRVCWIEIIQILVLLPTIGYMYYYIWAQTDAKEYTEMGAAIVSILFTSYFFAHYVGHAAASLPAKLAQALYR